MLSVCADLVRVACVLSLNIPQIAMSAPPAPATNAPLLPHLPVLLPHLPVLLPHLPVLLLPHSPHLLTHCCLWQCRLK